MDLKMTDRGIMRGYTTTVVTPWGRETYQVWLSEAGEGWMARIVTLPGKMWAMPGGREAVKFMGSSVKEAEAAAIHFIEEECIRTRRRMAPPDVGRADAPVAMPETVLSLAADLKPAPALKPASALRTAAILRLASTLKPATGPTADTSESATPEATPRIVTPTGHGTVAIPATTVVPAMAPMPGPATSRTGGPLAAPRYPERLLVRFGTRTPERPGVTANVSETGLFIITDQPAPIGSMVLIDLRTPNGPMVLGGQVVWSRGSREIGRSMGFGVKLTERPREYLRQVREKI